jgi:MoaA/NifB/PqqE/SkfB family radical SAM enzyme
MIHLLGRCNLKCLHCYMEASPLRTDRLPVELVTAAINAYSELGIGSVYLTGGEPLLYPDLRAVIGAAASNADLKITLCTNGVLFRSEMIAFLKSAQVEVNVSVDGEAAYHDWFRQLPGAFRLTERNVRALAEADVPVTIITTISQDNLACVPRLVAWAANAGARTFRVQPLLKLGRGLQIADKRLTDNQLNRLVMQLSDLANTYRARNLACGMIGVTRRFLLAHPCGAYVCNGLSCHRGVEKEIKKLIIREDGTVLPEITNLNHAYALGRLEDGPLSMLVDRYFNEGGYERFDRLCRSTYEEVLPSWKSVMVPWDQIVAERSHSFHYQPEAPILA